MKESQKHSSSHVLSTDKSVKPNTAIFDSSLSEVLINVKGKINTLTDEVNNLRNLTKELGLQTNNGQTQKSKLQAKLAEAEDQEKNLSNENVELFTKISESTLLNRSLGLQSKELSESYATIMKEKEAQQNQLVREENLKLIENEEATKKYKESTRIEEAKNDELTKLLLKKQTRRKELQKYIEDAEQLDKQRTKMIKDEESSIVNIGATKE